MTKTDNPVSMLVSALRTWRGFEMMWEAMDRVQRHELRQALLREVQPLMAERNRADSERNEAKALAEDRRARYEQTLELCGQHAAEIERLTHQRDALQALEGGWGAQQVADYLATATKDRQALERERDEARRALVQAVEVLEELAPDDSVAAKRLRRLRADHPICAGLTDCAADEEPSPCPRLDLDLL